MKKKIYFIPLLLLAVLGAVQYGCKEEADEFCQSFDAGCGAVDLATMCCTDNACYYEYERKRYDSDKDGMDQLVVDMCGIDDETSASAVEIKNRLKAQTQQLFAEARASVICE